MITKGSGGCGPSCRADLVGAEQIVRRGLADQRHARRRAHVGVAEGVTADHRPGARVEIGWRRADDRRAPVVGAIDQLLRPLMHRRDVRHAVEFGDRLGVGDDSVGPPPPPLRTPPALVEPEIRMYRLLPMVLIVCATAYCAPWPMAIISTTEPTPITMPSMVRMVRIRLAPIASHASPSIALSIRRLLRWGSAGR
jgi:hypothetical protein